MKDRQVKAAARNNLGNLWGDRLEARSL